MSKGTWVSSFFTWLFHHSFLMGRYFKKPGWKEILECFIATTIIGVLLGFVFGEVALLVNPDGEYPGTGGGECSSSRNCFTP